MNDNIKIKGDNVTLRQLKSRNRKLKRQLRAEQRKLVLMDRLTAENLSLPDRIRDIKNTIKDKEKSLYQDECGGSYYSPTEYDPYK